MRWPALSAAGRVSRPDREMGRGPAWSCLLPVLLLLLFRPGMGWCATAAAGGRAADPIRVVRQVVRAEAASLKKLQAEVAEEQKKLESRLARLREETVSDTMLEETRLAMESARLKVHSVELDLTNEEQKIQDLQDRIKKLGAQGAKAGTAGKNPPQAQSQAATEKKLQELGALLAVEQQRLAQLQERKSLLKTRLELATSWWQNVQAVYQQQQKKRHRESLEELQHRLQREEQNVQEETARLRRQLAALTGADNKTAVRRDLIHWRIEAEEESLNVLRTRLRIQEIWNRLDAMNLATVTGLAAETLKSYQQTLQQIDDELQQLQTLTSGKLALFSQQWSLLQKQYALKEVPARIFAQEKKILQGIIDSLNQQLDNLQALETRVSQALESVRNAYAANVKQSLTARQILPRDLSAWKALALELVTLPRSFVAIAGRIAGQMASGWGTSDTGRRLIFFGAVLALLLLSLGLGRLPSPPTGQAAQDLRFTVRARAIFVALLRGCRPVVLLGGSLLLFGLLTGIDPVSFHVLVLLVSIWFVLQLVIKLSYWVFVSPMVAPEHRQARLHYTIVLVASVSALFTLLVGLGNIGLLSTRLRDVIDRAFMLLLLLVVYLFMRLRTLLVSRIHAEWKSGFWVRMVALASLSIPLTALTAAVVGLAGYINLAWFVAAQLAIFLAVIMAWMVASDLVRDLLRNWKQRLEQGGSGRDGLGPRLLDSLEHMLQLVLVAIVLWGLARLYGWGSGNAVSGFLKSWLGYPLFHVGGQAVTLFNVAATLFLLVLVFYVGVLARQVAYFLFYRNVTDRGLRNSLSIFTQYAVLVIGVLIALNTMGFNLTSLTVFAGALGVGIGFGLQNIANNLISGLILLAERPVRIEDWIAIGDKQGVITRIGIRSLTLRTWNNQEVILPNAQLITEPVTNWTLSDRLIRTVFQVGIHYHDDPHQARDVLLDAVSMVPEVSLDPAPRVYLTEFGSSSVNFRVEFFSESDGQAGQLSVKSQVMFAIWDALKDADIGIPFPQQDIYIKELPSGQESGPSPLPDTTATPPAAQSPGTAGPDSS
ncbi:MAG TPA: mechanosensitive ion channel [Desulfobulbus sp.]|nr:mechanosensitive ion channel [Desulfobulbus sp.]